MAETDSKTFRTDAELRALQPAEKQYSVPHAEIRSLKVRVHPSGAKQFLYVYDYRGKRVNHSLGGYPALPLALATAEASRCAADLEHLRKKGSPAGQDPASLRRTEKATEKQQRAEQKVLESWLTFEELAAEVVKHHCKKHRKNWKQDESQINRLLLPPLGKKAVADITRRELVKVCDSIEKSSGPSAANSCRALLSLIYNVGTDRGLLEIEANVAQRIKKAKETPRTRTLSDKEVKALWEADCFGDRVHDALKLQLCTAGRIGEIVSLKWQDVDFDRLVVTFREVKQGGDHTVPIVGLAEEILRRRHQKHAERSVFVFPGDVKGRHITIDAIKNALQMHRAKLAETPFASHDVRRTVRRRLGELAVDYVIAERVLGHSIGSKAAKAYDHADYTPQLRQALERWERALQDILEGRPINVVPLRREAGHE
jgi:integrase